MSADYSISQSTKRSRLRQTGRLSDNTYTDRNRKADEQLVKNLGFDDDDDSSEGPYYSQAGQSSVQFLQPKQPTVSSTATDFSKAIASQASHSRQPTTQQHAKKKTVRTTLPPIDGTPKIDRVLTDGYETSRVSFQELNSILHETNQRRRVIEEIEKEQEKKDFIVDDDYDELFQFRKAPDKADVKTLERWDLELKKKKNEKKNEDDDLFLQKETKKYDDPSTLIPQFHTPAIRVDFMNKIFYEQELEMEMRKKLEGFGGMSSATEDELADEDMGVLENRMALKGGLENTIRDHNEDILNGLIMKKIHSHFKNIDLNKVNDQNLRLQVQMITEQIANHFSSLRSVAQNYLLKSHLNQVVQKLRSKNLEVQRLFDFSAKEQQGLNNSNILDYKVAEKFMVKTFEKHLVHTQKLRHQQKHLMTQNYKMKQEIRMLTAQMKEIKKKGVAAPEPEVGGKKRGITVSQSYSKAQNLRNKSISGGSVEEFLKHQRMRNDIEKQEKDLQQACFTLEQQISRNNNEIERMEQDLRNAKGVRAHAKMQLKDLYYKVLKDEDYLLKEENTSSYVWVVRALWKINQEILLHHFPNFLDKESKQFMLDYSRAQEDLLKYCRENNLRSFTAHIEEFKYLDALEGNKDEDTGQANLNQTHNMSQPALRMPGLNTEDDILQLGRPKNKDLKTLMAEMNSKIVDMKKVNLKAKRQVHVSQYGPKGRTIVTKWEDVNPWEPSQILDSSMTNLGSRTAKAMFETSQSRSIQKDGRFKSTILNPIERATEMLERIKGLKEAELQRLQKYYMHKDTAEEIKDEIYRIFKYLFGKKDGDAFFATFIREKRNYDYKYNKAAKAIPIKDMSKKMMPNQHLLLVMKENTGRSTTEVKESTTGRGQDSNQGSPTRVEASSKDKDKPNSVSKKKDSQFSFPPISTISGDAPEMPQHKMTKSALDTIKNSTLATSADTPQKNMTKSAANLHL